MNTDQFDGHTPGPWYVDDAPDVEHPSVVLADDGATIVAEAMTVVAEQHDAGANAQLIAAAPDLLAEVKRLREENKLVWKYVHFERMYDDGLLTVEGEFIGDVKELIEFTTYLKTNQGICDDGIECLQNKEVYLNQYGRCCACQEQRDYEDDKFPKVE